MNIQQAFVRYGLLDMTLMGLIFSVFFWVRSGSSMSPLQKILAITLITAFRVLLYFLFRYYPVYSLWMRRYLFEKPKEMIQQYYRQLILPLPKRSIRKSTYYLLVGSIVIATFMLGILAYQVLHGGFFTQWNLPTYYAMRELRSPDWDAFWVKISLFNSFIMFVFWGAISLYFILKKDAWRAAHWVLLGLFIGVVATCFKYGLAIPRPGAIFTIKDAFPSAHVTTHMTLLGGLILLLDFRHALTRWATYILYAVWLSLISFSRLYLAAHWVTDILGGALVSFISLCLFSLSYYRRIPPNSTHGEFTLISLGSLSSLWLMRFILTYSKVLNFYMASF